MCTCVSAMMRPNALSCFRLGRDFCVHCVQTPRKEIGVRSSPPHRRPSLKHANIHDFCLQALRIFEGQAMERGCALPAAV
jgi:hypothetical protein